MAIAVLHVHVDSTMALLTCAEACGSCKHRLVGLLRCEQVWPV